MTTRAGTLIQRADTRLAYAGGMLYLASQSPRRRQLLEQIGYRFAVLDVEVPEVRLPHESPRDYVSRVARDKALAGWAALMAQPGDCVLAADTEVVLGDEVLGKPRDAGEAAAMLERLQGREHDVVSSVWCADATRQEQASKVSRVRFAPLSEARIAAYVASGEPFGKAGGYAIQGLAGAFVVQLEGSYSGVMGLPLYETSDLLQRMGQHPANG